MRPQTDWTIWQDADVARRFARDRRSGILGGVEQLEVLCQLLPPRPANAAPPRVLDLGCGDGVLLETVLQRWPGAQGVALDGSAAMLEQAETRLSVFPAETVFFVQADFNTADWIDSLPFASYDVVVSGFAIHHSEDEQKRVIYGEIFNLLKPGGVFIHCEHVASASLLGEELFERAYALNLARTRTEQGQQASFEEVLSEIRNRLDKSANRLTPVETQLQWLREIGFTDVDCYWKYYELAVMAGRRPE